MKKSIVLATAVASVLTSGIAAAELTANAAISSNYIWRGLTQTNDQAAGSGGIDWAHDSGFYVGTWVSNVAFGNVNGGGYEMDVYAGYGGEVGGFGYDLGAITYQYPVA
ncbi:MAG: TorF family putative porin, partial [Gammaproteobacteria bacterium]|nr:TorF family putative porin [Gammaproteobacteria bacterium]